MIYWISCYKAGSRKLQVGSRKLAVVSREPDLPGILYLSELKYKDIYLFSVFQVIASLSARGLRTPDFQPFLTKKGATFQRSRFTITKNNQTITKFTG